MTPPIYLEVFIAPIRDNAVAQVGIAVVLVLIALDIVFGLGNALAQHKYSSAKMRQGIAHKSAEIGMLMLGAVADASIIGGFDLGFSAPVLVSVCVYLSLMEIGSLLETFADMNPQLAHSPLFRLLEEVETKIGSEARLLEGMPTDTASPEELPTQENEVQQ